MPEENARKEKRILTRKVILPAVIILLAAAVIAVCVLGADRIKSLRARLNMLENTAYLTHENYDFAVKAVAHRGYSSIAPENTLPAYKLAKECGFHYVETDVSFTADGVAVCLHDKTVDRTSNGRGIIGELSFEEVRQLDFGSWKSREYRGTAIPSFEEFILLCRNLGLHPYIEMKSNETCTAEQIGSLLETVRNCSMEKNVTWISMDPEYLSFIRDLDPPARLGYVVRGITEETIAEILALRTESNEVFLDSRSHSEEEILLCKENDIPLEVWTIDDPDDVLALDPYISGVASNSIIAGKILRDTYIK